MKPKHTEDEAFTLSPHEFGLIVTALVTTSRAASTFCTGPGLPDLPAKEALTRADDMENLAKKIDRQLRRASRLQAERN